VPTATYFCTSSPACLSAIPVAVATAGALPITPLVANRFVVQVGVVPSSISCVLSGPSAVAL
jgi:hypothetical protein